MVTSFHHQPEAQHPNSSAINKLPADYPIYWHLADIPARPPDVRFRGKADITIPGRYVRF